MAMDRRSFLSWGGLSLLGIVFPKPLRAQEDGPEEYTQVLQVSFNVAKNAWRECKEGGRVVGNWIQGNSRTFPSLPGFCSEGQVPCLNICFQDSRIVNYPEREYFAIYRIHFPLQELSHIKGVSCVGGRVVAVASDHVDVEVDQEADDVELCFEVEA